MNSLEIPHRRIYKLYPGAWEEITARDAPYVGRCLYYLEKQEISVDMFRKLVVDRFIHRVNSAFTPTRGERAWNMWANESRLADSVNFFFSVKTTRDDHGKEQEAWEVIPGFVKNLLPWVRIGLRRYVGPGDFLSEMSFEEFKDLNLCCQKWMETKEEIWLTRLMAIGYRPPLGMVWLRKLFPGFKLRTRQVYNPTRVEERVKRFVSLDIGHKYIFFQYLMGCLYMMRTNAQGQGIEIEGNRCNLSLVFGSKNRDESPDQGIGMMGVIMALAETGVFGDIHQTARADFWDVISRLYQLELQARELESKHKKQNK